MKRQYADITGVRGLFAGYKSKKKLRVEVRLEEQDRQLSTPDLPYQLQYEARVNADIARHPWVFDWNYWPLMVEDEMRAERRETMRKAKLAEHVKKLEQRLVKLKRELKGANHV